MVFETFLKLLVKFFARIFRKVKVVVKFLLRRAVNFWREYFKLFIDPSLHFPGIIWRVVAIIRLLVVYTFLLTFYTHFGNLLFFTQSRPEYFCCDTNVAKCKDDCALEYNPASLHTLWRRQVTKL